MSYVAARDEQRVCKDKVYFPDRKRAKRRARLMRLAHHEPSLSEYRCPFCAGYHIGHTNRKNSPRVMRPDVV